MNRWKSSVLHEGEGNIRSVKWRGHLIAWANNMGVKVFDITSKQRISNVPRDDISLRPDMYPCSLCWKDNVTLIIGWGTSIKICSVKERHASEMRDLPSRYVEIGHPQPKLTDGKNVSGRARAKARPVDVYLDTKPTPAVQSVRRELLSPLRLGTVALL